MKNKSVFLILVAAGSLSAGAANPFLPLWEYIPDGEPYVFDDPDNPGRQRVYVYGSHDTLRSDYCGRDQVVWSAPVEDLNNWRFDVSALSKVGGKKALYFVFDSAKKGCSICDIEELKFVQ